MSPPGYSPPKTIFRPRVILIVLLALAAALRVYWVSQSRVVWGDETFYLWVGQSLLDGHGYQFFGYSGSHFSPLFPLLTAIIAKLAVAPGANSTQALMTGSAAVHVVSGTLLVLPIYDITRRIAGLGPALAAALATAIYPLLTAGALLWSTGTEVLYLLLLAMAWWGLLIALQDGRLGGYILAGGMLGLAYLARTETLVYLAGRRGSGSPAKHGAAPFDWFGTGLCQPSAASDPGDGHLIGGLFPPDQPLPDRDVGANRTLPID